MYFIDEFETELSKREIIEKLKNITESDKFWHVHVDGKFFCRAKFEDNGFTLFYLKKGRSDMLLPKIHGKITESEEICKLTLSYSGTWEWIVLFTIWTVICWIPVTANVYYMIGSFAVYIIGIWIAKKHCMDICKKVVDIMRQQLTQ